MKKATQRYSLPKEAVLPYFLDHITSHMSISKGLEEHVDFSKGTFFTFLPKDVSSDRLLGFEYGGIVPSISINREGIGKEFISMKSECSEFVANFLQRNPLSRLIIEDYNERGPDPAEIENIQLSRLGEEVYYIVSRRNSKEEVDRGLKQGSIIWHFLALVTSVKGGLFPLKKSDIPEICKNVQLVITCAYDGESYIFWEKD